MLVSYAEQKIAGMVKRAVSSVNYGMFVVKTMAAFVKKENSLKFKEFLHWKTQKETDRAAFKVSFDLKERKERSSFRQSDAEFLQAVSDRFHKNTESNALEECTLAKVDLKSQQVEYKEKKQISSLVTEKKDEIAKFIVDHDLEHLVNDFNVMRFDGKVLRNALTDSPIMKLGQQKYTYGQEIPDQLKKLCDFVFEQKVRYEGITNGLNENFTRYQRSSDGLNYDPDDFDTRFNKALDQECQKSPYYQAHGIERDRENLDRTLTDPQEVASYRDIKRKNIESVVRNADPSTLSFLNNYKIQALKNLKQNIFFQNMVNNKEKYYRHLEDPINLTFSFNRKAYLDEFNFYVKRECLKLAIKDLFLENREKIVRNSLIMQFNSISERNTNFLTEYSQQLEKSELSFNKKNNDDDKIYKNAILREKFIQKNPAKYLNICKNLIESKTREYIRQDHIFFKENINEFVKKMMTTIDYAVAKEHSLSHKNSIGR